MILLLAMLLSTADPSITAIAAAAGGTVGFAAVELATGRTLGLNQDRPFPMQSVFKLPIAIEVLHQVDAGKIALDQEIVLVADDARDGATGTIVVPSRTNVRKLVEAMVVNSDNVACDRLLALVGEPRAVEARMRSHGIEGITIRFSEREMTAGKGDNTATPAAMVALLGAMAQKWLGLLPASAKVLDDLLLRVATGAKRLKGGLPPGTPVAHKSGTSRTLNGKTDATNDVGLFSLPNGNQVAIAVFVHDSPADEPTRLPKQKGPAPFRLREAGPCLVPAEQRFCFHRSGSRPGPDVVQLFMDGARLHVRTGFGPQHGAKVFEDLLLDKAPEAAPK